MCLALVTVPVNEEVNKYRQRVALSPNPFDGDTLFVSPYHGKVKYLQPRYKPYK